MIPHVVPGVLSCLKEGYWKRSSRQKTRSIDTAQVNRLGTDLLLINKRESIVHLRAAPKQPNFAIANLVSYLQHLCIHHSAWFPAE